MGLHAPEGRDVATRLRGMNDDLYKATCKPNKIEKAKVKGTKKQ